MLTSWEQYSSVWRDADIFVIFCMSNHHWWTTIKSFSLKILLNSPSTCYYYVGLIFICDLFIILWQKERWRTERGKQQFYLLYISKISFYLIILLYYIFKIMFFWIFFIKLLIKRRNINSQDKRWILIYIIHIINFHVLSY